jgi:hypothetical protein
MSVVGRQQHPITKLRGTITLKSMKIYHWETWELRVVTGSAGKYCLVFSFPYKNVRYFYHEFEN